MGMTRNHLGDAIQQRIQHLLKLYLRPALATVYDELLEFRLQLLNSFHELVHGAFIDIFCGA
jgi:hypothetical protein